MTRQAVGLLVLAAGLALTQPAWAQANNHDHWGQTWSGSGTGLQLVSSNSFGLFTHSIGSFGLFSWTGVPHRRRALRLCQRANRQRMGGRRLEPGAQRGRRLWVLVGGSVDGRVRRHGFASRNGRLRAGRGPDGDELRRTWPHDSPQGVGVYGYAPFPGYAGYFSGNTVVAAPGSLSFGSTTRQMLNLWGPGTYGIGVQSYVLDFRHRRCRGPERLRLVQGGNHSHNPYDAGGGSMLMKLDQGGLTVDGTFVSSSDAALKQDVASLDVQQVLDAVGRLPIREWSYKADPAVRHIGPMAQDFRAAFAAGGRRSPHRHGGRRRRRARLDPGPAPGRRRATGRDWGVRAAMKELLSRQAP